MSARTQLIDAVKVRGSIEEYSVSTMRLLVGQVEEDYEPDGNILRCRSCEKEFPNKNSVKLLLQHAEKCNA